MKCFLKKASARSMTVLDKLLSNPPVADKVGPLQADLMVSLDFPISRILLAVLATIFRGVLIPGQSLILAIFFLISSAGSARLGGSRASILKCRLLLIFWIAYLGLSEKSPWKKETVVRPAKARELLPAAKSYPPQNA